MNPVRSQLIANYSSLQPATLELIDLTGKIIVNKSLQSGSGDISLDVSNIQPGIYLIRFLSQNRELTKKVEIIH
jgi:hypothetical protein